MRRARFRDLWRPQLGVATRQVSLTHPVQTRSREKKRQAFSQLQNRTFTKRAIRCPADMTASRQTAWTTNSPLTETTPTKRTASTATTVLERKEAHAELTAAVAGSAAWRVGVLVGIKVETTMTTRRNEKAKERNLTIVAMATVKAPTTTKKTKKTKAKNSAKKRQKVRHSHGCQKSRLQT